MKREEKQTIGAKNGMGNLRFLLCDITDGIADPSSPGEEWVASPIRCLDRAVDWYLVTLCRFLHYSKIDSQHEMTACGAYLDRMALGGRRLHELCETKDHLKCEYYLNPRRKS